ncbi:MAG: hypothetical protein SGI74_13380 [Oligoflexia bacterium]|nr:hypothetical protein [Oligoflexia bacterium]
MKLRHLSMLLCICYSITAATDPVTPPDNSHLSNYTIPLFFDFAQNGGELSGYEFHYVLKGSDAIEIADISIADNSISFELKQDTNDKESYIAQFTWPTTLITHGDIELIHEAKAFYTQKVPLTSDQVSFSSKIKSDELKSWPQNFPFKFCMKNFVDEYKRSFCSKNYILVNNKDIYAIKTPSGFKKQPQKILINDQPASIHGPIVAKEETNKINFKAYSSNGEEYEFDTAPPSQSPEYFDVIQSPDQKTISIRGRGTRPIEPLADNNDHDWRAVIDANKRHLRFRGLGEFSWRQSLKPTRVLPKEEHRIFLQTKSRKSTYSSQVLLQGAFLNKEISDITSLEHQASITADKTFDWNYSSPKKASVNRAKIKILTKNKEEFGSYFDIYRGLPYEAILRFTGLKTSSSQVLLAGELATNAWLEQIFGWKNSWLSVQRWGASARYFSGLNTATDSFEKAVKFNTLNFDLKYNWKPGVWNHDLIYGTHFSYQSVNFTATSASMLGLGAYYGMLLPKFIDKLLPFKHPKWINAQFDYYLMPATSAATLNRNFNLSSHLKIYFTPFQFIEMGLAYRSFDFKNNVTKLFTQTSVGSASLGYGLNF